MLQERMGILKHIFPRLHSYLQPLEMLPQLSQAVFEAFRPRPLWGTYNTPFYSECPASRAVLHRPSLGSAVAAVRR